MKKISIFFLVLCFLSMISLCLAEEIKLKSGKTINDKIVERTDKYIKVDIAGVSVTYFNDEIESIDGQKLQVSGQEVSLAKPLSIQSSEKTPEQIFKQASDAIVVIKAISATGSSLGSGFIVDKSGVVLTNFHVVASATDIEVKLKDGRRFSVTGIIDSDRKADLCVLKIDAPNLTTLSLGDSDKIEQGEKVLVIGAPLGLEYTISDGLISGIRQDSMGFQNIQFSAPTSKGNSGGPLLNMRGEVVGIAFALNPGGQNLNFAIPINDAKKFIGTQVKMSVKEFGASVSKAYNLIRAGREAEMSGNIDLMISYTQRAVELDPDDAVAHSYLGYAYGLKKMLGEAISELEKAIALDPNNDFSHNNLGSIYSMVGRLDEGFAEFKKALAINPNNPMAHANLGRSYYGKGMFDEAVSELKKAISIEPNNGEHYYNLSFVYYKTSQYDLAIQNCDRAIKLGYPVPPQALKDLQPYRR